MIQKMQDGTGVPVNNNQQYTYILTRAMSNFQQLRFDEGAHPW